MTSNTAALIGLEVVGRYLPAIGLIIVALVLGLLIIRVIYLWNKKED